LFKDILSFQRIRYSQTIVDLARALAYQIGNEVNESELANRLKIDRKTVQNYIAILEKSFVITRLYPYSTNLRREIGKNCKIYFLDIGIRNALIGDFNELNIRSDRGAIWENFIIVERLKTHLNQNRQIKPRFWRSYSGAEVDYIEEAGARNIKAFEIKMGDRLSKKLPNHSKIHLALKYSSSIRKTIWILSSERGNLLLTILCLDSKLILC